MIHELIEQKKKSQRATTSRNTKAFHDPKLISQTFQEPKAAAFEASDSENKEAESSSAVFIPPWLRNSLGLNQRNNLRHLYCPFKEQSNGLGGPRMFTEAHVRRPNEGVRWIKQDPENGAPGGRREEASKEAKEPAPYPDRAAEAQIDLDWSVCLPNFNALGQGGANADSKSTKNLPRGKGVSQNELDSSLKTNVGQDRCKKPVEITQKENFQEVSVSQDAVQVEDYQNVCDRRIPIYWNIRHKKSDSGSSCTNLGNQCKSAGGDIFGTADSGKIKIDEKKRLKFFRPRSRMNKHVDPKQSEMGKNDLDYLLEIKAREALENYSKNNAGPTSTEVKHREPKFLLLGGKTHNQSSDLNQEEFRLLREFKNQVGGIEDLEKVFEHVKDANLREPAKNTELPPKNLAEKTGEKEEKFGKGLWRKYSQDGNFKGDKDSLLSTDDENDIKRFSEFLSKNKNQDEKRKCLEEVRNYFERKRRTRLTKRCAMGDEKLAKQSPRSERKEEQTKDKSKSKESYKMKRSKLSINEEAVEKAVEETLQKFVEMHNFRVSPTSLANMKKSIIQAIKMDISDGYSSKFNEIQVSPMMSRKVYCEPMVQEPDTTGGGTTYVERDALESPRKESRPYKEVKKKNFRTYVESFGDQMSKPPREGGEIPDCEKLKRLRKDFEGFLHSVQGRMDISNLVLQSLIIEKDGRTPSARSTQLVYNFSKKMLESQATEVEASHKESLVLKTQRDSEVQTAPEPETNRKNIKIQTHEQKSSCEQGLQTEDVDACTRDTQTEGKGMTVQEISELKSHEVSAGLYRMVKSKDAGKFYLYPEDGGKQEVPRSSKCYIAKGKKSKRAGFLNVLSKERRILLKERERHRIKKTKRALQYKNPTYKIAKRKKAAGTSEDSINCLYFRNLGKNGSESLSSKKEMTDENAKDHFESEERMPDGKDDHLGCFWFWNGEKIAPGCDLKTHVENLVKEKLTEMTTFEGQQNDLLANALSLSKNYPEQMMMTEVGQKPPEGRALNPLFCYNMKTSAKDMGMEFVYGEPGNLEERKNEGKRKESGDMAGPLMSASQEKPVKNVGTQNSQSLSLGLLKLPSRVKNSVRRKCTRRNIIIKPAAGRSMSLKKAEVIIRAVEEIKKMNLGLDNAKNDSPTETEFMMEGSTSTLGSNKIAVDDPESGVLSAPGAPETVRISNGDLKSKLEKLINLVDREVQTADAYDCEDSNSVENEATGQVEDRQKHFELIESILGRVSQKERETLWKDVRQFIKTKIGKDVNDEGAREVCIEIEQNMPQTEPGNAKQPVTSRGHYSKDEGEVEVEIDLTLEDLAKLLRQKQRKIRRRNLCWSSKSKTLMSSSSVQSDVTRDDLRRYHKYLQKLASAEGNFLQDKELREFLRNKGN